MWQSWPARITVNGILNLPISNPYSYISQESLDLRIKNLASEPDLEPESKAIEFEDEV